MIPEEKENISTLLDIKMGGDFEELEPARMGKQFKVMHVREEVPISVTYEL